MGNGILPHPVKIKKSFFQVTDTLRLQKTGITAGGIFSQTDGIVHPHLVFPQKLPAKQPAAEGRLEAKGKIFSPAQHFRVYLLF